MLKVIHFKIKKFSMHLFNIVYVCRIRTYSCRQRINTRLPGGRPCIKMVMYTAALQDSQPNRLYTRLPDVNIAIYTAAVPEQFQTIYKAAVCLHKIAIYTAAIQWQNWLYTLLSGVYKKSLFTRQPLKSQIGYIHCCRVYT